MSESRVNRSRKPKAPGEDAPSRDDALKDALPDTEPPSAIKKMGNKPVKKGARSSSE